MAAIQLKNNAYSTLAAGLTNVATTLTVVTGHGDRFPALSAGDWFMLTLQDAANNIEIVKVTARTAGADSMTIARAQEGTTARTWAIGDVVESRITAGIVTLNDAAQTLTNKTINLGSNTLVTTLAQLNSAISDADVPSTAGAGASGTWGISISGNAATATNATTATTANGLNAANSYTVTGLTATGAINEARGTVAMHATTMNLWGQPNVIDGTGSAVTITAIANAPQAGARRTLYPIAGTTITNGATFAVDGAANYTTAAGDALEFEAVTTSAYKVHIIKKDGTAVVSAAGGFSNLAVITASGNWTVPAGVTKCKVTVVGGGGSGASSDVYSGPGGAGGGTSIKVISGLTPGGTVSVTIGAGATGAAAGTSGNAGGTSSFGAYCSATGGSGGVLNSGFNPAGGVGSGGDLNICGDAGGVGRSDYGEGGGSYLGGGGSVQAAPGNYGGGSAGAAGASFGGAPGVVVIEY